MGTLSNQNASSEGATIFQDRCSREWQQSLNSREIVDCIASFNKSWHAGCLKMMFSRRCVVDQCLLLWAPRKSSDPLQLLKILAFQRSSDQLMPKLGNSSSSLIFWSLNNNGRFARCAFPWLLDDLSII